MPIEIKQELYEVSSGKGARIGPCFFANTKKQAMDKAASLMAELNDLTKERHGWFRNNSAFGWRVRISVITAENPVQPVEIATWYQVSGDCWVGPPLEPKFQDERVAAGYKALADL